MRHGPHLWPRAGETVCCASARARQPALARTRAPRSQPARARRSSAPACRAGQARAGAAAARQHLVLGRNVQCSECAQKQAAVRPQRRAAAGVVRASASKVASVTAMAARGRAGASLSRVQERQRGLRATADAAQHAAARAHARTGGGRSGHQARAARRSGARRGGPEAGSTSRGSLRPAAHRGDARGAQRRGHSGRRERSRYAGGGAGPARAPGGKQPSQPRPGAPLLL